MKIVHEIKAEDLLSLICCLSGKALRYHGLTEDDMEEL
jgi:hypothetical protein